MALELDSSSADARCGRGYVWSKRDEYREGDRRVQPGHKARSSLLAVYYRRAYCWNETSDFENAIADLNEALRLDPDNADALCSRGWSWTNLKQYDKSISDYTRAIRIDPICVRLSWTRCRQGANWRLGPCDCRLQPRQSKSIPQPLHVLEPGEVLPGEARIRQSGC